ncbi:MFS transporter [Mucilaginibacter sp.]|uniref:MFS transporter n=1 Tax=Mucilaginibacter sp. TaxID=1882438 RepID=UPI00261CCFE0|nr:MFS transporter [Mucilaginibacter sp.]MDB4923115.1 transporter [Mucilaginibacter sp.]
MQKDESLAGTKEWMALAVLALPTLLVSMDTTVVYLAIPSISSALKPTSSQQLWITDIYGFIEAGLLITLGSLGDRIGRRKLLLMGAVAFAFASALAAFAKDANLLIAARALLGMAGATLLPSTLSMVRNMFHNEAQRAFAIGLWTTCFSTGTMLGPLVGGFLLGHFWWGSVFLMGVPVMLLFLILGPLLLPEFKDPGGAKFDLTSVFLLIASILPVTYGIKQIAEQGIELIFMLPILAGVLFSIAFLRRQRRLTDPLINLSLFKIPPFRIALVTLPVSLFMWAGIFLFVSQYLQLILNMDPFTAGLWTLPAAVASTISCASTHELTKVCPKPALVIIGLVTMAISLVVLTQISGTLPVLIIATILLSLGCGLVVTLSTNMVMTAAPPERAGAAAGISETSTALGASFGIALLGSIGVAVYRYHLAELKVYGIPQTAIHIAQNTFGAAVQAAKQLNGEPGQKLISLTKTAFLQSFQVTAGAAAVVMFIIAIVVGVMFRQYDKQQQSNL